MKKGLTLILTLGMLLALLSGCVGTPVVYECTCPTEGVPSTEGSTGSVPTEGAVKTGLSIITTAKESKSAEGENGGEVKFDVSMIAVTVDDSGVIRSCTIDGIPAAIAFDGTGAITSDLSAQVLTKNELGEKYGMVAWGGAKYEWDQQVDALAQYAVGKTVEELKNGAVDESGKAPQGSDLASMATIYLGGHVAGIEAAVNNAKHLGAQAGDQLVLTSLNSVSKSTNASAEQEGLVQLDADITALTRNGDKITSCVIDSVQAKVNFDGNGVITSDISAPIPTKNELGEKYGMAAWGGAKYEWDQQAGAFAQYVTGKTAQEVSGIAVSESTKPAEGTDLASSVTISIAGFQALIAKAMQ